MVCDPSLQCLPTQSIPIDSQIDHQESLDPRSNAAAATTGLNVDPGS